MTDWIANGESGSSVRAKLNAMGHFAVATIRPTSAQLKALNTVPLQIVAAPGVGFAILILAASATYLYGAAPYTNTDAPYLFFTNASGPSFKFAPSTGWSSMFAGSVTKHAQSLLYVNAVALDLVEDRGLYFADDQAWADGDGTAVISVAYVIVPVI